MDFHWSSEQALLKKTVRKLAAEQFRPTAFQWDGAYPEADEKILREQGLYGVSLPKQKSWSAIGSPGTRLGSSTGEFCFPAEDWVGKICRPGFRGWSLPRGFQQLVGDDFFLNLGGALVNPQRADFAVQALHDGSF